MAGPTCRSRRPLRRAGQALAAALLLLFGAPVGADDARHAWTVPGTLRVALLTSPDTLNPILTTSSAESFIDSLVFDGLVYALPDGTIEPDLAAAVPTLANGGISRDGRTIVYHLRHGVRWQDGAPFTSADVAFTQAAIMNPANNVNVRQPYDHVVRVDTPDPFTAIVHLRSPYAPFIVGWNASAILPAHLLAGKHDLNADPFNSAPVGTGAFRLERWERGSELALTANPSYFEGPPRLQHVVVKVIQDETAGAIAMRTHEIDWLFQPSPREANELSSDPDARVERLDVNEQEGIYINLQRPILADRRVRRALSLAIDRAGLAAKLGFGFLTPATADIPSFMWAYDRNLRVPYDPGRARALLDTAGWKPGADGIRVNHGARLSLTLLFPAGKSLEAAYAVQLEALLRAVGVELQLKGLAPNVLFAIDGPGFRGQFDLALTAFFWLPDPDDSVLFACANVAPRGNNWSRFCDRDFERWTTVALTHNDRPTRRNAYAHIERIMLDQLPEIITDWQIDAEPVSVDLRGFRDRDTFSRPYRWSI